MKIIRSIIEYLTVIFIVFLAFYCLFLAMIFITPFIFSFTTWIFSQDSSFIALVFSALISFLIAITTFFEVAVREVKK